MTIEDVVERAPAASKETLEDYTLRFAPRSYRRWTPAVVGASALGGIAYMADFSIGAGIGLTHGTGERVAGHRVRRARHLRHRVPAGLLRARATTSTST